ncbi:MAG: alpha/beta hydrolase [Verrucomicrobiales bacterium]|nr:alpha/beta hydrolase [Verrucomicrobiales bacterium]
MAKSVQLLNERERILLKSAQALTYRKLEEGEDLSIRFYFPRDLEEGSKRPVILFFHGGAWDRGVIIQFAPHALYYLERGAVCGLVEYRHKASHPESTPIESIQDGQTAVQFVRHFSEKLHIDPNKVILVGAGSGANIAGCAGMKAHIPMADTDYSLSDPQPNAVVMLSSIIDLEKGRYGYEQFSKSSDCRKASLSRYVSGDLPPMLMIHGTADRFVPFEYAVDFAEKLGKRKSRFQFVEFEGRDQNFFNHNTDPVSYEAALSTINEFLEKHGFLEKSDDDDESRLISWRECDY